MNGDVLQNFTDLFDQKIDRKLTAKKSNLTRFDEKQQKRLSAQLSESLDFTGGP